MEQSRVYTSPHDMIRISRSDRGKELEMGRSLTTGSRIASVKLSGGDIFDILQSAC